MAKIRFELEGNNISPTTFLPGKHSPFNNYMVIHKGSRRELRYCETEKSIWKDEQNKDSVANSIIFTNGILEVDDEINETLVDFLRTSPKNGVYYKEVNLVDKAKEAIEEELLLHEAKGYILEATEEELSAAVKILIPSIAEESIDVIKQNLLSFAKEKPSEIISRFKGKEEKESTNLEAQVKTAFDKSILIVKEDGSEIQWGVNQEKIVAKKEDKDAVIVAVNFFKNAKNIEHKELLIQRLSEDDQSN